MIDKILNGSYGDIFPKDKKEIIIQYKSLCKQVHPDVCGDPRAADAFSALTKLYNEALAALETGTWVRKNVIELKTTKGTTLEIPYLYHNIFEIGEMYVCPRHIIYLFDFSKKKYYNNYIKQINNLSYADKEMEKMFKPLFPSIIAEHDTVDNKHVIVVSKTTDVHPLRCVIENFYNGKVPATHMAWIISRLMNICCYLKYKNIVHNGLSLDNLFVSLDFHTILIEGGWWYAVKEDNKMLGTTKDIFSIMSPKVKADKNASSTTDVETVKAFGRKYVSDDAPSPFLEFLNSGTKENSMEEMEKWDKALTDSFGKRKFIKIEATNKQIYKK